MKWDIGKSFDRILQAIRKQKSLLMTLSVMTVFVTTYLLILPALTLEKDVAKDQGGIDVPVAEEMQDADRAQGPDMDTDAEAAGGSDTDKSATANSAGGLTYEGDGYTIEAAFDAKAGLPEDTQLTATEITSDADDYDIWHEEALKAPCQHLKEPFLSCPR